MATIEDLYSQLIREGIRREVEVVAEFCVSPRNQLFKKEIDVAWVRKRDEPTRFGSLRQWQIVAAFEIEGYDVPLDRLQMHTSQFKQLWEETGEKFPCFVPLYTRAFHRADPDWGSDSPERNIQQRIDHAIQLGAVIDVRDGRDMRWLGTVAGSSHPTVTALDPARTLTQIAPPGSLTRS